MKNSENIKTNTTRRKELKKVKKFIYCFFEDADCGLYDTRNLAGDNMTNLFTGDYFILDICFNWSYFEVFGTTKEEFKELLTFYNMMLTTVDKD